MRASRNLHGLTAAAEETERSLLWNQLAAAVTVFSAHLTEAVFDRDFARLATVVALLHVLFACTEPDTAPDAPSHAPSDAGTDELSYPV